MPRYLSASVKGSVRAHFQNRFYREVEASGILTVDEIAREETVRHAVREAIRHSRGSQLCQRVDTALHEMSRWGPAGQVAASTAEEDLRRDCGLGIVSSDDGLAVVGKDMPLEAGRA